jgi:hypothetical protein
VKGLRARGGLEVDIEWKESRLTKARIRKVAGGPQEIVVRVEGGALQSKGKLSKGAELVIE